MDDDDDDGGADTNEQSIVIYNKTSNQQQQQHRNSVGLSAQPHWANLFNYVRTVALILSPSLSLLPLFRSHLWPNAASKP